MCGIAGIVSEKFSVQIERMVEAIAHRGPDDSGIYHYENLALGHRRLSIQDLSKNGHQPMLSEDERYILVFNGEIYNHWDIRKKLEPKYKFRSTSDTETLLYALAEFGKDMIQSLNGIFAFAFFDKHTKELLLAKDHFGTKPLYFYSKDNHFAFSSEIKSLCRLDGFDKSIDYSALVYYINFLYCPGKQTPFEHVKKLLPGHLIQLNISHPERYTIEKYYQLPFNGKYKYTSEQETIKELDNVLTASIERQLLSDVEIGYFLSGGLDSSLLATMAAKIKGDSSINCYSIVSDEMEKEGFTSDISYARKIARSNGFKLNEIKIDVDIVQEFDKIIYHLDEPQADPAPINVLKICDQARKDGLKVLIGGTAGDDLFSGYRRHQALKYDWLYQLAPGFIGKSVKEAFRPLGQKSAKTRRINKFLRGAGNSKELRCAEYFSWLDINTNHHLFSREIRQEISNVFPNDYLIDRLRDIPNEQNWLNRMLYWEFSGFLPDHNLNYTDKMSMASGVEVRVPYLDQDLVNFSTQIAPNLKMKGSSTKYILKKVAEKYLDKSVIYRPKTGFGAPIRKWITQDLEEMINSYLSEESIKSRGIFDYNAVQKLIRLNKEGKLDASYSVWSLLAIESWFRQFVD